jgi:hypothetical protein
VRGALERIGLALLECEIAEARQRLRLQARLRAGAVGQSDQCALLPSRVPERAGDARQRDQRVGSGSELDPRLGCVARAQRVAGRDRGRHGRREQLRSPRIRQIEGQLALAGLEVPGWILGALRDAMQAGDRSRAAWVLLERGPERIARPRYVVERPQPELAELAPESDALVGLAKPGGARLQRVREVGKSLPLAEQLRQPLARGPAGIGLERPAVLGLRGPGIVECVRVQVAERREQRRALAGVRAEIDAALEHVGPLPVPLELTQTAVERREGLGVVRLTLEMGLQPVQGPLGPPGSLVQHRQLQQAHRGRPLDADELLERVDQALLLPRAAEDARAQLLHRGVPIADLLDARHPLEGVRQRADRVQLIRGRGESDGAPRMALGRDVPERPPQKIGALRRAVAELELQQPFDHAPAARVRLKRLPQIRPGALAGRQRRQLLEGLGPGCSNLFGEPQLVEANRLRDVAPRLRQARLPRERCLAAWICSQGLPEAALGLCGLTRLRPERPDLGENPGPLRRPQRKRLLDVGDLERGSQRARACVQAAQLAQCPRVLGSHAQQLLVASPRPVGVADAILEQLAEPEQQVPPLGAPRLQRREAAFVDPGQQGPGASQEQLLLQHAERRHIGRVDREALQPVANLRIHLGLEGERLHEGLFGRAIRELEPNVHQTPWHSGRLRHEAASPCS